MWITVCITSGDNSAPLVRRASCAPTRQRESCPLPGAYDEGTTVASTASLLASSSTAGSLLHSLPSQFFGCLLFGRLASWSWMIEADLGVGHGAIQVGSRR
jgi:hypothetical protein